MIIFVTVIHVLVCIGLILVVLLQTGKGAEVGAVFGGSSSTIFGSSGAGNFLSRLTTGMAIVFMVTSLTLGYFAGRKPTDTIFDNTPPLTTPLGPVVPKPEASPTTPPQAPAQTAPSESDQPAKSQ
ncbi:MAG: preprotein translocase subunit SecG [Deltaproteobacteria bacterium]|nr:preprotein translocase subunit SecG [Deltaproteobacteria bacterium]